MISATSIILLILAYLIGSIPFSVIAARLYKGIDIREYGSGNAGATNTFRVLGFKIGMPVLILDILKGFFAVYLTHFTGFEAETEVFINLQLSFGIAAVLGHIFPIYVGFRGGKGVATILGFMIAVFPIASLCSIVLFLITFFSSKYVSLSSILASLVFPFAFFWLNTDPIPTLIIFSIFVPILIIATHQSNIERLISGEENKANLSFKKKK
jgi:glycerol-3-phosphate acyltransferase PlsY